MASLTFTASVPRHPLLSITEGLMSPRRINIGTWVGLHGKELAFVCFLSCGSEVMSLAAGTEVDPPLT